MKTPDISLTPPRFKDDPDATREMSAMIAKLTDILRDIYGKLITIEVVDSAPASTLLSKQGDGKGGILTDVKILNHATATSRKIYYLDSAGNLRTINSA